MVEGSCCFFFSSRRRHTRYWRDWSSDVCSSDLIALASLFGGILNSLGRFWVAAAAPILLNLCLIVALLLSSGATDMATARAQAVAVTVSGVLQLAWLVFAARRVGMAPRLRLPKLGRDVKALMRLILPAALG